MHFHHAGQEHHFWPLHQSILQQPGDPTIVSSGWVVSPTSYLAAVKDDANLVTLGNLVTIPVSDTVVQTFVVTATAALTDVQLIVYTAFDMNAPFYDYGEVTPDGIRVVDTQTLMRMELEGENPDAAEVGSWNDGPYPGDDVWQHALVGELGDVVSATQYVEGALAFDLGDFSPGQAKSEVVTLTLCVNTPPMAAFTVTPTMGYTDTIFTCDASASYDHEDAPTLLEVRWDFEEDGLYDTVFTTVKTVTHTYATTGVKTIRLEVRDTGGLADTITHTVTVAANTPPVAAFIIVTPTVGYTDTIFTCDASASYDDRDPLALLEVRWDFEDDGLYDTLFTTTRTVTHTYATTGIKTIRLEVRDTGGLTDTTTHTVTIETAPPICPSPLTGVGISGPTEGYVSTAYVFTAVITPSDATSPITYTWTPQPESGQGTDSVSYEWATPGVYTITLTAENCGGPVSDTHAIAIEAPEWYVYLPLVVRNYAQ